MTPSELKAILGKKGSKFFTRSNMRFMGDTMANYGVRKAIINTIFEDNIEVWELYRKRPVKHGLKKSAYFTMGDFRQTWPKL